MNKNFGKTIYYTDPLNDDFAGVGEREKIEVDSTFKYINRNPLWRLGKFIVYRVFVTPFAYLYCKLKFGIKIVGKKKIAPYKRGGYFLYGNHTQVPGDGFIPNLITFPKTAHVIVSPENIALRGTRNIMMMLGALPTPTDLKAYRNFSDAIAEHIEKRRAIVVYPEAHIWPYYTSIRPFPDTSFAYPAKLSSPVFAFTVTYRKTKREKPRIVVYVDGPYVSDATGIRAKQKDLREQVHSAMCERAYSEENHAFITYLPKEEQTEEKQK